ncbi:MAG TPA: sigma-70 family RNA polymerase sigma factor [Solirubrobacteraceae bacterium]|nr:sigma-70 family RNA polymerase sigma factor [Solirubrobacteraceae bacterium]
MSITTPTVSDARQQALLRAARRGDEHAFAELVEPYGGQLHAHCYRMLGSVQDAEDALQDALLRAWRGLKGFEGRSSWRSWLYRIATNASLDVIGRRPKRMLPVDFGPPSDPHEGPGPPLLESVWVEPYPDGALGEGASPGARYEERESVELAFIAALQHLPARQRATLILREVLGFSAREVADSLQTSVPSVNSALQRARRTVDERTPDATQQQTLRALGDRQLRAVVERYVDAWEHGDVDGIVSLLASDAAITMPPMPTWYRGRDAVAGFLRGFAFAGRWDEGDSRFVDDRRDVRLLPARVSGQVAFGSYSYDAARGEHRPLALQVLTFDGGRIGEIAGFVIPQAMPRYGLPDRLPAPAGPA